MLLKAAGNSLLNRVVETSGRAVFAKTSVGPLQPLAVENCLSYVRVEDSLKADVTVSLAGSLCRKLLSKMTEVDVDRFLRGNFVHHPVNFTSAINAHVQIVLRESSIPLPPELVSLALQVVLSNGYARVPVLWNGTMGFGLWAFASSINHSCQPNSEYYIDHKGNLHLYSIRPIDKDDEITVSYLPPHTLMSSVDQRRKAIKELGFFCKCPRCMAEKASAKPPTSVAEFDALATPFADRLPHITSISEFIQQ